MLYNEPLHKGFFVGLKMVPLFLVSDGTFTFLSVQTSTDLKLQFYMNTHLCDTKCLLMCSYVHNKTTKVYGAFPGKICTDVLSQYKMIPSK